MFTHEVDTAIERYRFGNVEVAFSYDTDPDDPMDFCSDFCGIERVDCDPTPYDRSGWLNKYDTLSEELSEIECGDTSWSARDIDEVRGELSEYAYFELQAKEEYGWPTFRVAIHKPTVVKVTGHDVQDWEERAQRIVDIYAQWSEGRVYIVGVEDHATGVVEYMGGIYNEPTEELARELAEELIGEFGFEVAE